MSRIGDELKQSMQEMLDFVEGRRHDLRVTRLRVYDVEPPPLPPSYTGADIRRIREALSLSQAALGQFLLVSPRTIQSWEQNQSHPSKAACRLLQLVENPALLKALYAQPGDRPETTPSTSR